MPGRAVLVGAGHAHLFALKRTAEFRRRGHELVAVAPDRFWYSGLATGMLGGMYPPELDQVDVAALVVRGGGRFIRDRIVGLNTAERRIELAHSRPLSYDALSLTLGSEPPAIPGADRIDGSYFSVKPIRRLWELRRTLERRLRATRSTLRVVVAGGGATACEVAANISTLAQAHAGRAEIIVLAAGPDLLVQLPRTAARMVKASLTRRGIRIRCGAKVERVEPGCALTQSGQPEEFDVFVNATGLEPPPVMRELGLPLDGRGALMVDANLRSVADPAVHGAGDCITLEGHELPRIGVYAIRQAPVLFANVLAALEGRSPRRFRPQRRYLWILNLGDGTGLAVRGSLYWHGRSVFWLKDWIDRRFLREYQVAAQPSRPMPG